MQFLREQPAVSLADAGPMDTFIADILDRRPVFDDIARFSAAWSTQAAEKMQAAMERKNCAVTWVQLVIDQHGLLVILRFGHPNILCAVKTAANVILRCLPDAQRLYAQETMRPLDEVDRDRITAWQTVESLRPQSGAAERKRPRDPDEFEPYPIPKRHRPHVTEEYISLADVAERTERNKKPIAQLLAEWDDDSEEEWVLPRPMLTNGNDDNLTTQTAPRLDDPAGMWKYRAETEAIIVIAEVGERPERLLFRRCHREERRKLLLQNKVREKYESPAMLSVVRVAMQLVKDGSMPGPGQHGRKREFIKRCAATLQALDPTKETDLTKLNADDQALIRQALGGDTSTPYDGCLSMDCLNEETIWETSNIALPGESYMPMSRCSRCKHLKAFGRKVNSIRDILQTRMESENNSGRKPWTL